LLHAELVYGLYVRNLLPDVHDLPKPLL